MRTHYQNLKVAEDAPIEVIKAAWRALCQQHHPDKNHGDPKAVQVMQIINAAYEVLSDPVKRGAHDDAIKKFRARSPQTEPSQHPQSPPQPPPQPQPSQAKVRQWWALGNDWRTGPYTLAELAAKQRSGIINMQTYVCECGTNEVISLHKLLKQLNKVPVQTFMSDAEFLRRQALVNRSSFRGLRERQSNFAFLLKMIGYLFIVFFGGIFFLTAVSSSNENPHPLLILAPVLCVATGFWLVSRNSKA